MAGTIRSETDDGGVLTAWVDLSDRPVNLLSAAVWDDLELLVGRVAHAPPSGLVIASAKPLRLHYSRWSTIPPIIGPTQPTCLMEKDWPVAAMSS